MSYSFKWVCWLSAWMLLCSSIGSAEDIAVPSSTPPSNSSIPMGLHGYRRYFANDSFIGSPVSCSREDKICFRHNLVFDPYIDRCKPLEHLNDMCRFTVNEEELERSDEHVAHCRECKDPCSGYRMAYDGICYKKEVVNDVICGRDANLTRHPFGNFECRAAAATPISVKQPEQDGACAIPDLRFPDVERRGFFSNPLTPTEQHKKEGPLECEPPQAACFSKRSVFVSGYEGCHTLLNKGPCAEDHVVALDLQAASEGRAEGTCVDVRGGCPKGYKRMLFDGQCHENREIEIEAPGEVIFNQFGQYIVLDVDSLVFAPKFINDKCEVNFRSFTVANFQSNFPPSCESSNNDDDWSRVASEPPQPQLLV